MSASRQSLEKQLHSMADSLRGRYDPLQTVRFAGGVLLLKYLSDQSSALGQSLGADRALQLAIPAEAEWCRLESAPSPTALMRAVLAIESHPKNELLAGTLSSLGLPELASQPDLCGILVDMVSGIDLRKVAAEDMALTINSLLGWHGKAVGRRSGEHYTPSDVSLLMAELLAAEGGSTIYDPTCGTGSMLLAAYQQSVQSDASGARTELYGQEMNVATAALARVNLFLKGPLSAQVAHGDALLAPGLVDGQKVRQYDYIISNPPMGLKLSPSILDTMAHDEYGRFAYGPPGRTADFAFIQHIVASLNPTGRAVILVAPGVLLRSGKEGMIRKHLIEADLVEAVISLPAAVLSHTSVSPAILMLNKAKPASCQGRVLLVHAAAEYEHINRRNQVNETQRQRIVQVVRERSETPRFAVLATLEEIAANDHMLAPARYVDLVGLDNFLGGTAKLIPLAEMADVLLGARLGRSVGPEGSIPVIRGRDLANPGLTVDDLGRTDHPADKHRRSNYAQADDILVQRIGHSPATHLVEEELAGILIGDTVYIIRSHEQYRPLARYLAEFLSSDIGRALLAAQATGASVPTIVLRDLRRLKIPIPDRVVLDLIGDLHEVEQALLGQISEAREIRQRLFGIEDADQINTQLRHLGTEARILSASLVQADDLDFQVRNFYPFALAYAYRLLSAILDPPERYREQLRVAENILAFLGSVGLALAAHTGALSDNSNEKLTNEFLAASWQGGISPGHWRSVAHHAGELMRSNRQLAAVDSFAALWFRGSGRRQSDFGGHLKTLVEIKNDYKHDRGPRTPQEYEQGTQELKYLLAQCLEQLAFFVQHPIRLIQSMDRPWGEDEFILETLAHVGDHPGLRHEQVRLAEPLSRDKLYLELTDQEWVPLYPLVSVQHCPACRTPETYMIDRCDGPSNRVVLKSFERGHTLDTSGNHDEARQVGIDLERWLHIQFAAAGTR